MYLFSIISSKPARADHALARGLSNREAKRAFQTHIHTAMTRNHSVVKIGRTEILFADGERIHIG